MHGSQPNLDEDALTVFVKFDSSPAALTATAAGQHLLESKSDLPGVMAVQSTSYFPVKEEDRVRVHYCNSFILMELKVFLMLNSKQSGSNFWRFR